MRRYLIAVNLHEVLYDSVEATLQYLRLRHNHIMPRRQIVTMDLSKFTGVPDIDADLVALLGKQGPRQRTRRATPELRRFYETMPVYPWAHEALEILNRIGPVIAITKRPESARMETQSSLTINFGNLVRDVFFLESNPAEWASRPNIKVTHMFEHFPKEAARYARKGIVTYVPKHGGPVDGSKQWVSAYYRPTENVLSGAKDLWARVGGMVTA